MQMTAEHVQGRFAITILAIHGDFAASNYEQVIAEARDLYAAGTRHLLLDLSDVPFMGSSGVVALHSIALLLRGETPPDRDSGWQAFHAIDHARADGVQQQVKLFGPQPKVSRTLQMTSMTDFFEIHTDKQAAIESFQ
jgi:anti-anti-sigma regulatory factor